MVSDIRLTGIDRRKVDKENCQPNIQALRPKLKRLGLKYHRDRHRLHHHRHHPTRHPKVLYYLPFSQRDTSVDYLVIPTSTLGSKLPLPP